jgi:hypothetical protein
VTNPKTQAPKTKQNQNSKSQSRKQRGGAFMGLDIGDWDLFVI